MATTTSHRRRSQQQEEMVEREVEKRLRQRRRPWRLILGAAIFGVLLWFLPGFVAHTPLLGWIVNAAAGDLDGSVHIESASLGWFSPVGLSGVEVRDPAGQPVARVASAASEKSLVGLLMNLSSLGKFRLEKPTLEVVLRADGSNVEDLIAPLLAKPDEPSKPLAFELEIVDGTVNLLDQVHNLAWQIDQLQLGLAMSGDETQLIDVKTSAVVVDRQPGKIDVMLSARQAASGQFAVTAEAFPLPLLDGLLARLGGDVRLAGRLGAKLNGQWGGETGKTEVQGDLNVSNFVLTAAALGPDRLQLDNIETVIRAAGDAKQLEIERARVTCDVAGADVAGLDVAGRIDLTRLGGEGGLLQGMLEQTCEARGELDIARLAAMLPDTLRIRPQTRITSGRVSLTVSSRREAEGMRWQAAVEAKDIKALDGGRQLTWERPVAIGLDARQSPRGPIVDLLSCESDFLTINASGNFDDLAGNARFDLKQLAAQLGQFIDLSDVQLDGQGWMRGHWKRAASGDFDAQADVEVLQFAAQLPGGKPLTEPKLTLAAAAKGNTSWAEAAQATRIHEATISLQTNTEQLDAQLTAPLTSLSEPWPLKIELVAQLENLLPRLAIWLPLDGWRAAGALRLTAQGSASSAGADVREARVTVEPLQVASTSVTLNEPKVELSASGGWQRAARRVSLGALTLVSGTLSARGENLVLVLPEQGPFELGGALSYQADVARLVQCLVDRSRPPAWKVAGIAVGNAEIKPAPGGVAAQLDADVTNLTVTDASGKAITEPRIHAAAKAGYDYASSTLKIEQAEISSAALAAAVTGRVSHAKDTMVAANGQMSYDLERLTALARPYLGTNIRLVGRGASPAAYEGPFDPAAARGHAGLKWDYAEIYGFPIGRAEFKAKLADGWLVAEPIDVEVSGGRMSLAPQLKLAPSSELILPKGKLAEQIQITPGMCASAMKFALPILADVAEARGTFSIELDGCRLPLADPAKGDIAGRLLIHSVEVGAGPLIRELALLMGRATPGKLRRESVVDFRMVNGRVYHQGLELIFPDITIRTHGSVGLDQSLAMLVETPVPPKWIEALGNTPIAATLKNQTLRVPIGGTLSRPALDRKVLDELNRQFVRSTARNVIEGEVGPLLDRLLGPPK